MHRVLQDADLTMHPVVLILCVFHLVLADLSLR